jgi:ribosomal protein S19E (S16A)
MSVKSKVESIEEYLARGGSIKKLPSVETVRQPEVIRKLVTGGPVTIMSLEEADLFYGEARKGSKPKKAKPSLKIDLSALPEALRSKFINKLKEEADGENYEEENTDEEEDSED